MEAAFIMLIAPAAMLLAARAAFRTPGRRPGACQRSAEGAALVALAAATAGGVLRIALGPGTAGLSTPLAKMASA